MSTVNRFYGPFDRRYIIATTNIVIFCIDFSFHIVNNEECIVLLHYTTQHPPTWYVKQTYFPFCSNFLRSSTSYQNCYFLTFYCATAIRVVGFCVKEGAAGGTRKLYIGKKGEKCIKSTPELVFLNIYGTQESIPRNEFRQPM